MMSKRYSWNDTHTDYDKILKTVCLKTGKFPILCQYTDENGIKHFKTKWYSNITNSIDDFKISYSSRCY